MTRALWWLWLRLADRVPGSDRVVLAAGITIRVGGALMLCYALPLTWAHQPRPVGTALLVLAMLAQSTVVVWLWLWQRRVGPLTLALEAPTGVLALFAGGALAEGGRGGGLDFMFPYTILISAALGLASRRLWPGLAVALLWATVFGFSRTLTEHRSLADTFSLGIGYLVNPTVGWLSARTLRRRVAALDQARLADAQQAAELATTLERARHGRALHDRVLQTLETLARGSTIPDPAVRARVGEQAAWLRRFVETGQVDQDQDLPAGLSAAARAAERAGIRVQLNDARLRVAGGGGLAAPQREALVQVVHQAISSITGAGGAVVVRAVPDNHGVLVTLLGSGPGAAPPADELADLVAQLAPVGGTVTAESVPFLELRVPTAGESP
ncbi:MAG: hypothetical protein J2P15_12815 [Micromonosporaceae bacterium]|nr:hypothetical protein [Micromonosporaceae bacterium]